MKHKIVICLSLIAVGSIAAATAKADPIRTAQVVPPQVLPPYEIMTILRSAGLNPLSQPVRRGGSYVLRAVDDYGEEVRVIVGAQRGEIRMVQPVPISVPYETQAPVYGPGPRYADPRYGGLGYDPRFEWAPEASDPTVVRPPRNIDNAAPPSQPVPLAKKPAPKPKAAAVTPAKPLAPPPSRPTEASAPPKPAAESTAAAPSTAEVVTPPPAKAAAPAPAIPPVQGFE